MNNSPSRLISVDPASAGLASGFADTLRPGSPCPTCKKGKLDYNGLLELECDHCGTVIGNSSACT